MSAACPFCRLLDEESTIIAHNASAVCLPDAYPCAPGHCLVVPRRCVASIFSLTAPEAADLWQLVQRVGVQLSPYGDGLNVGVNVGAAAGQTVPHAHVHLIPRHAGDVPDPRGGVRWVLPAQAQYWPDDPVR